MFGEVKRTPRLLPENSMEIRAFTKITMRFGSFTDTSGNVKGGTVCEVVTEECDNDEFENDKKKMYYRQKSLEINNNN